MQSHFTHHVTGPFCCSSPASTRRGLLTCCLSSAWREKRLWLGGAGHLVSPAPWLCCPGLHPPTICTQQPTRDPRTELSLFSEKKRQEPPPGAGRLLHSSLWLMAFRFQTLSPLRWPALSPFCCLCPQQLPRAAGGGGGGCAGRAAPRALPLAPSCALPLLTPWRCCWWG